MGQRRVRKGFLLTLDAIIAITLLLSLALFIGAISITYYSPDLKYERLYYMGKDLLLLVENADMDQLSDFPVIDYYISEGVITPDQMDKSLLEVVGSLWASDNLTLQEYATNITGEILNETLPEKYGYEVLMDGSTIFRKNGTGGEDFVSRFSTIVSGFELGKPVSGFVARAWATKISKNTTDVITFDIEGAGNDGGDLKITKYFTLNSTAIESATFYVSIHYTDMDSLQVNGNEISGDINWIHSDYSWGIGTAAFGTVDVTDYLQNGSNTVYLEIRNDEYNSHIHPGMRIEVTYKTEEIKNATETVKERIFFDNILSEENGWRKSGAWATVSFYIPENSTIKDVTMHLRGEDIEDIAWRDDVRIYYKDDLYDTFNPPANGTVDVTYNFTDEATEGTNWVLVQLNYRISSSWWGEYDDFTGDGDTIIYSDPLNDPDGSSYIDIEYEMEEERLRYGYIDIGLSEMAGGSPAVTKTFSVDFEDKELIKSFVHIAQLFSYIVRVRVRPQGHSWIQIFESPSGRVIPSSIYVDPNHFDVSVPNDIEVREMGAGYNILPETSLEYRIWIPSSVGYGDVNKTLQGALDDAVARLNQTLGKYAVATTIAKETYSVSGVPSMWGPAILEVRVWG
jgi:hypothetical protein